MQPELHIAMACSRPRNIARIAEWWPEMKPHPFALRWHILYQAQELDRKGYVKLNQWLNTHQPDLCHAGSHLQWQRSWVWMPSDDSLPDPRLFDRLGLALAQAAPHELRAVVFGELRDSGHVRLTAHANNLQPGLVDGSQYFLRRDLTAGARYDYAIHGNEADGHLIQELHAHYPQDFAFVDEPLVRHNSLEWDE